MDERIMETNNEVKVTEDLAPVIAKKKHIGCGKIAGAATLIAAAGAGVIWLYKRHKAKKAKFQVIDGKTEDLDDDFDDTFFDDNETEQ